MSKIKKKLINVPEDAVDEALAGLVAACPGLRLLQYHRVIVRCDIEEVVRQGKVRGYCRVTGSCCMCHLFSGN